MQAILLIAVGICLPLHGMQLPNERMGDAVVNVQEESSTMEHDDSTRMLALCTLPLLKDRSVKVITTLQKLKNSHQISDRERYQRLIREAENLDQGGSSRSILGSTQKVLEVTNEVLAILLDNTESTQMSDQARKRWRFGKLALSGAGALATLGLYLLVVFLEPGKC